MPAGRTLLVGAGRESTRATIAAARRAAAGAPTRWSCERRRSIAPTRRLPPADHYLAVAEASPVPVLLYNYPAFNGVNLTPDCRAPGRASQHRRREGDEDHGAQFAELAAVVPERFTILSGRLPLALFAGAEGPFSGGLRRATGLPRARRAHSRRRRRRGLP